MEPILFDRVGLTLTLTVFIASAFLFVSQTGALIESLFAALLAASLFWISYVIIRWVVLALKK